MIKTRQILILILTKYLLQEFVGTHGSASFRSRFFLKDEISQPSWSSVDINVVDKLENVIKHATSFSQEHLRVLSRLLIDMLREKNKIDMEKAPAVYWYSRMGR